MKNILILGTGCAKCAKLYEQTKLAASELGQPCDIQKITDLQQIMGYGVMMTPALVVEGVVKVSGRIPSLAEIKQMLA